MRNPLLSICIPTYNRANCLKDCLESIVSQCRDNAASQQIEVVISDNASTDNTKEIVSEFQNKFTNLKYFRNNENIGFDRNFSNVVEKSSGVYCLTIGDDDSFFDGSIPFLLKSIENYGAPFFGLNSWGYDNKLKEPILPSPNLLITKDASYEKLSDFVRSVKNYASLAGLFGGMSTHLFLREPWVSFKDKEKFLGTQCAHMFILLTIFKNSRYVIMEKPVIKTRSSNVRWESFSGLETAHGRTRETIKSVKWIKGKYNLPISNAKITAYILGREYWFTMKEAAKVVLSKLGLGRLIAYYRKIR